MNATITRPTVNGKPIQFVGTAEWNRVYGGLEATLYLRTALAILQKYPYDMLVFEQPEEGHYQVRLAGYHLGTEELNEELVVFKTASLEIRKFWLKIDTDEQGNYIGTFLFPEEY
jgi:hypothetical protein